MEYNILIKNVVYLFNVHKVQVTEINKEKCVDNLMLIVN